MTVDGENITCPSCGTPAAVWVGEIGGTRTLDAVCRCTDAEILEALDSGAAPTWREGSLAESDLAARLGVEHLKGRFVAWGKTRWSRWTGTHWRHCDDAEVYGAMRAAVAALVETETAAANRRLEEQTAAATKAENADQAKSMLDEANAQHAKRLKQLAALFWVNRIKTLLQGAREVLHVRYEDFDSHPELLNVRNGVVDMRTGELLPHDPALMLTKICAVEYDPDAEHADWRTALTAVPAEVADWLQVRFGQAATGYPAPDAVVPFLNGGGENGKSTVLDGIIGALGDYATQVPDKALIGSASDHPTELMTLKGARFAYIEELPEGDYLNPQRLKKISGTTEITARYIGQDNVTWRATHCTFVTTNYSVKVDAVDHGTWRRLALVRFPFKFLKPGQVPSADNERAGDPGLKQRMERNSNGQWEAVLAWLVAGARRWFEAGEVMPAAPDVVQADTETWRHGSNKAVEFLETLYEAADGWAVSSAEVFADFSEWAQINGFRRWTADTFWTRAEQHPWFTSGKAVRTRNPVFTKRWQMAGAKPERARLVQGIRRADQQRQGA
ncbi:phage/plasmid primase, P4 family [Streptomyces chitinivorans]|uniref:Phage/plasmid primase, P4 family n=1 Tax=Streptomyces chitinivorans TaxID=1257027 RepID=A0ABW7HT40_9ACTN|nr:phage/plasmid primase, P4 family [Streptomyces chitinivorans]MDH2409620.1 phage/plasmid primase, P4 family [Streptomyces chitinivorans]